MLDSTNFTKLGKHKRWYDGSLFLLTVLNLLLVVLLRFYGSAMYPFFNLVLIWIASYTSLIALLIRRERLTETVLISKKVHLLALIAVAILFRCVFLGTNEIVSLDPRWYIDFGRLMHSGYTPYVGFYFPYPPVFAYIVYTVTALLPTIDGFRMFSILTDAGVIIVLWKLAQKLVGVKGASTAVIAYALLPVSIFESGWNAHFEPLPNLLLLLALWLFIENRYKGSGVLLGLSIATKIYPAIVAPIFIYTIKGWRNRITYTLSVCLAGLLSYLPLMLPAWLLGLNGANASLQEPSSSGVLDPIIGFLQTLPPAAVAVSLAIALATVLAVIYFLRLLSQDTPNAKMKIYYSAGGMLGLILVLVGGVAGIFPLLPLSTIPDWRFPIDIGIVRGLVTVCVGLAIIVNVRRDRASGSLGNKTKETLLLLIGSTALLIIVLSRLFFFGWYLLWSIPFFLLMRDRRLGYIVIIGLLLIFPNYTSDNFSSLGIKETRYWEDNFDSVNDWSMHINIKGSSVNASDLSMNVISDENGARFRFDTRNIVNSSFLENISFSYTQNVSIVFNDSIDFVTRIAASWDWAFGHLAEMSLTFKGNDSNGRSIDGSIIPTTNIYTNISSIEKRYAFSNAGSLTGDGLVTLLNVTIFPLQQAEASYKVDYIYTTHVGILRPLYFFFIPALSSMLLIPFVALSRELDRERTNDNRIEQKNLQNNAKQGNQSANNGK